MLNKYSDNIMNRNRIWDLTLIFFSKYKKNVLGYSLKVTKLGFDMTSEFVNLSFT